MCVIYDALLYEIGNFSFMYLLARHMSKVCINVKTNRSKSGYICCSESVLPEGNHAMKSQTFFCFDFIFFLASQRKILLICIEAIKTNIFISNRIYYHLQFTWFQSDFASSILCTT